MLKSAIGVNSAADFRALAQQADDGNFNGGLGTDAGAFQTAIKKLMANDGSEDLGRQARDFGLAASMYDFIGSQMRGEDDNGFKMAASALEQRASMIGRIADENAELTSQTNTDKPFETMRQVDDSLPTNNTNGVDVGSKVASMKSNAASKLDRDVQGNVKEIGGQVTQGLIGSKESMSYTPIGAARELAGKINENIGSGVDKLKDTFLDEDDGSHKKSSIESSLESIPNFKPHGGGGPVMPSQVNLEGNTSPKNEAALYGNEAAKESAKASVTQDENGNARLEKDLYGNFTASDGSSYIPVGDITGADGEYVGEGYVDSVGNYYAYQYGQFVDMGMDDPTKDQY